MPKSVKTPRWARCTAIAILTGLSTGILAIFLSSFFFYRYYANQFPDDTQNLLSALTSGVVVGIGVCAVVSVATAGAYLLFGLSGTRGSSNQNEN